MQKKISQCRKIFSLLLVCRGMGFFGREEAVHCTEDDLNLDFSSA
jgi:hypothetical protein